MGWWLLLAASVVEICMAVALRLSEGWTRVLPGIAGVCAALGSIFLLTLAVRTLPIGTAYAVWTGLGATGVTAIGVIHFGESASLPRLMCIGLIVCGVIGLKLLDHP